MALAVKRLRVISERGAFSLESADLIADIDSIALIIDFFQFAQSIAPDVPGIVRDELSLALSSPASGALKQRQAKEFQSQFWVGRLLSGTGYEPRVLRPSTPGPKPDYIVDFGTLEIAFEVKRPRGRASIIDAMDRAAGQLRAFGRPGIVCVDLSDSLITPEERLIANRERRTLAAKKQEEFLSLAHELERRAPRYVRSDKYERIVGMFAFARLVEWDFASSPKVSGQVYTMPAMYSGSCSGLVAHSLPRIQRLLLQAVEEITGSAPRRAG